MTERSREPSATAEDERLQFMLGELPIAELDEALTRRIKMTGHAKLEPRPVPKAVSLVVAMSAVSYLGWAFHFVTTLR